MHMTLASIELTLTLLQQTCVYLVIAYLLTRTRIFIPLMHVTIRLPHRATCYIVFSLFCILGTYLGLKIDDSIANTRAIGAVLGGVLGGPSVGLAVGFTGGLHRYSLGGPSALACMVSTVAEGLIGGLFHYYMMRRGRFDTLFNPLPVALVTFCAEVAQMLVLLLLVQPPAAARHLVEQLAVPMLVANSLGAALFMRILLDRRELYERQSSVFSTKALGIAARVEGLLRSGFNVDTSGSPLAHMYYVTLGNLAYHDTSGSGPQDGWGLKNAGPFSDMLSTESVAYWSGTPHTQAPSAYAWYFYTLNGYQHFSQQSSYYYAVAVRPGDVFAVPEPASVVMLLAGLGAVGAAVRRRRKR